MKHANVNLSLDTKIYTIPSLGLYVFTNQNLSDFTRGFSLSSTFTGQIKPSEKKHGPIAIHQRDIDKYFGDPEAAIIESRAVNVEDKSTKSPLSITFELNTGLLYFEDNTAENSVSVPQYFGIVGLNNIRKIEESPAVKSKLTV